MVVGAALLGKLVQDPPVDLLALLVPADQAESLSRAEQEQNSWESTGHGARWRATSDAPPLPPLGVTAPRALLVFTAGSRTPHGGPAEIAEKVISGQVAG